MMCHSTHHFADRAATHYHTRAWQTLIKDDQDGLKRTLESKIDRLRNYVLSTIDEKMKA